MSKKKDVLQEDCLVLNKGWNALNVESMKSAITKVSKGAAEFVDYKTYETIDFEKWQKRPIEAGDMIIYTSKRTFPIFRIILLTDYNEIPKMVVKINNANILIRDNGCCQYCGCKLNRIDGDPKMFTKDHVHPKCRGGKGVWDNIVSACKRCNSRKGDRTLKECGMSLLKKPVKPNLHPLYCKTVRNKPPEWEKFLDNTKWDNYATLVDGIETD